jgi:hypothetical protein
MKNFEKNIDLIVKGLSCKAIQQMIPCKNTVGCENTSCKDCNARLKEYLLEEHEEKIELTQFEYDLLKANVCDDMPFLTFTIYMKLKEKGYFKGVKDTTMAIGNIVANAKVVE